MNKLNKLQFVVCEKKTLRKISIQINPCYNNKHLKPPRQNREYERLAENDIYSNAGIVFIITR